jgi:hypothetical protein
LSKSFYEQRFFISFLRLRQRESLTNYILNYSPQRSALSHEFRRRKLLVAIMKIILLAFTFLCFFTLKIFSFQKYAKFRKMCTSNMHELKLIRFIFLALSRINLKISTGRINSYLFQIQWISFFIKFWLYFKPSRKFNIWYSLWMLFIQEKCNNASYKSACTFNYMSIRGRTRASVNVANDNRVSSIKSKKKWWETETNGTIRSPLNIKGLVARLFPETRWIYSGI